MISQFFGCSIDHSYRLPSPLIIPQACFSSIIHLSSYLSMPHDIYPFSPFLPLLLFLYCIYLFVHLPLPLPCSLVEYLSPTPFTRLDMSTTCWFLPFLFNEACLFHLSLFACLIIIYSLISPLSLSMLCIFFFPIHVPTFISLLYYIHSSHFYTIYSCFIWVCYLNCGQILYPANSWYPFCYLSMSLVKYLNPQPHLLFLRILSQHTYLLLMISSSLSSRYLLTSTWYLPHYHTFINSLILDPQFHIQRQLHGRWRRVLWSWKSILHSWFNMYSTLQVIIVYILYNKKT